MGWAPGAHRPGKAATAGGTDPRSQWVLGALGVTQEPAQQEVAEVPLRRGKRELDQTGQAQLLKVTRARLRKRPPPRPLLLKAARPDQERGGSRSKAGGLTTALAPQCWPKTRSRELGLRRKRLPQPPEVVTEQVL